MVQHYLTRTITKTPKYVTPILCALHWLIKKQGIHLKIYFMVEKRCIQLSRPTIRSLFTFIPATVALDERML